MTSFYFQLGTTIVQLNGATSTSAENGTTIATFGELDPLLAEATDRYTIQGTRNDTAFDYTFTINGTVTFVNTQMSSQGLKVVDLSGPMADKFRWVAKIFKKS